MKNYRFANLLYRFLLCKTLYHAIRSYYRMVPSAIWEIFSEVFIFTTYLQQKLKIIDIKISEAR